MSLLFGVKAVHPKSTCSNISTSSPPSITVGRLFQGKTVLLCNTILPLPAQWDTSLVLEISDSVAWHLSLTQQLSRSYKDYWSARTDIAIDSVFAFEFLKLIQGLSVATIRQNYRNIVLGIIFNIVTIKKWH